MGFNVLGQAPPAELKRIACSLPWIACTSDVHQHPVTGTFLQKLLPQNSIKYGQLRRHSRKLGNTAASSNLNHHRVGNDTVNVAVKELRGQKQMVGNERKELGTVPPGKPAQP